MSFLIGFYFIAMPLIVIVSVIGTVYYRRRRMVQTANEPPFDFQKTDELFIDPTTGIKQQVWFNPRTGERYYQTISDPASKTGKR